VVGEGIIALRDAIMGDDDNAHFTALGWEPVFAASPASRILLVGQAPGRRAQETGIPWNDPSGDTLLGWLGVDRARFHDPDAFAIVPMDFYFPGKSGSGDAPPRRAFADRWHPPLLELLPNVRLTILAGAHAQKYYLPKPPKGSLSVTETVRSWRDNAPVVVPIVHPSPLTIGWRAKNPWFEGELVPELRALVAAALAD